MTQSTNLPSWHAIHLEIQFRILLLFPSFSHKHFMFVVHPASYHSATFASIHPSSCGVLSLLIEVHFFHQSMFAVSVHVTQPQPLSPDAQNHVSCSGTIKVSTLCITFWPILKALLLSWLLSKWDPVLCGCTALFLPLQW